MDYLFFKRQKNIRRTNSYWSPFASNLVAYILGISVASQIPVLREFCSWILCFGLFIWLLVLTLNFFETHKETGLSKQYIPTKTYSLFLVCIGTFFFGAGYFYMRVPQNPYPDFSPKEMNIVVKINDVSNGAKNSFYGTATIVDSGKDFPNLKNKKIWYNIYQPKTGVLKNFNLQASELVEVSGVLSDVRLDSLRSRGFSPKADTSFEEYLKNRFIHYKFRSTASDVKILKEADKQVLFFNAVRSYMQKSLQDVLISPSKKSEMTFEAMMLGDKSLLDKSQKEAFQQTGTMHVFAISGLHVGFAAGAMIFILTLFRIDWRIQPVLVLPALYLYVQACGGKPSAMRAFTMVAVFWIALALSRNCKPFHALLIAASIALLMSPAELFDAGFCLSYAIVAGLFVYGVELFDYLKKRFYWKFVRSRNRKIHLLKIWFFNFFVGGFCISLAAAIVSMPLSAYYFGYIAPVSILYSPLFVAGAGIAVSLGFIGFILPHIFAQITNSAAVYIVWLMNEFACLGSNYIDATLKFPFPSGILTAVCVVFFLGASILTENSSAFKRFVGVPIISIAIFSLLAILQ